MSVYDFKVNDKNGNEKSLKDFAGKVLIIVNTASKCGFTPQFEGLEALYKKYKDQGLEIIGFPSNQFAEQDPGSNEEIQHFCKLNYGVTFPVFAKVDVRGENAIPLYQYLTEQKGDEGMDGEKAEMLLGFLKENLPQYLEGDSIKWNFTKFLVDREGNVVERFEPVAEPADMVSAIEKLL